MYGQLEEYPSWKCLPNPNIEGPYQDLMNMMINDILLFCFSIFVIVPWPKNMETNRRNMETTNSSSVTEFVLSTFDDLHSYWFEPFVVFFIILIITITGNRAIIALTFFDSRLQGPIVLCLGQPVIGRHLSFLGDSSDNVEEFLVGSEEKNRIVWRMYGTNLLLFDICQCGLLACRHGV